MAHCGAHDRVACGSGIDRARNRRAEILENSGSRLVGTRSCDAAAARQRRVHFLRVVWESA